GLLLAPGHEDAGEGGGRGGGRERGVHGRVDGRPAAADRGRRRGDGGQRRQSLRGPGTDSRRARLPGAGDRAGRLAQRDPAVVVPAARRRVCGAAGVAAVPAPAGAGGGRAGGDRGGRAVAVAGLDDLAVVATGLAPGRGRGRGRRRLRRGAVAAG